MANIPQLLCISPPGMEQAQRWLRALPALARAGADGALLRVPRGAPQVWVEVLHSAGLTSIVHLRSLRDVEPALALGCGLHLPAWEDPGPWRARVQGLLGQSCHDLEELCRAAAVCDYATLSPIFAPRSKPADRRPTLGLGGLSLACRQVRMPVLALGGLCPGRVAGCLQAGAAGVAGIGGFGEPVVVAELAVVLAALGPKLVVTSS